MKKKVISAISLLVVLTMICTLFTGCVDTSNTKKFSTESDMINALRGTWYDDYSGNVLVINGESYNKYYIEKVLVTAYINGTNTFLTTGWSGTVKYNLKGYIELVSDDGTSKSTVLVYDNFIKATYLYDKISTDTKTPPQVVLDAVEAQKESEKNKQLIEDKKKSNININDFKYAPFSYVGKNVYVEGTAELDTYFNWGYSDLEPICFCISVTPKGGSYMDTMYIYATRDDFADLFKELQNGSKQVLLIYNPWFYEGYEHDMGWLTEYYLV